MAAKRERLLDLADDAQRQAESLEMRAVAWRRAHDADVASRGCLAARQARRCRAQVQRFLAQATDLTEYDAAADLSLSVWQKLETLCAEARLRALTPGQIARISSNPYGTDFS